MTIALYIIGAALPIIGGLIAWAIVSAARGNNG
jgi:hypothetical protein